MDKYVTNEISVEAFKYDGTEGQLDKYNVLNDYELVIVDGVLLDVSGQFSIEGEEFRAEKGDWIVLGGFDEIRVFSDQEFHKFFKKS